MLHIVRKGMGAFRDQNKARFQAMEFATNESDALVLVSVGLYIDKVSQQAIPVITGAQWISREETIDLLKQAIEALNPKIIEDEQKKNV